MLQTEGYIVDPDLFIRRFACDLPACRGACCTFAGGSGAPVDPDEIREIRRAYPVVRRYLPEEHRMIAERDGLIERASDGTFIRCLNQRACLFVMYDGGIAFCSIQHAYLRGEFDWIKPRSCHLFPVRLRDGNPPRLSFEFFTECGPAVRRGENEQIPLLTFLEAPLRRVFGDDWYESLRRHRPQLTGNDDSTTDAPM